VTPLPQTPPQEPGPRLKPRGRPMIAGLIALALTGGLYIALGAGFLAMLWTIFQFLMWVFGG
jgi:hypothetical protein